MLPAGVEPDETTPPVTAKIDIRSASLNYTETTNVDTLATID